MKARLGCQGVKIVDHSLDFSAVQVMKVDLQGAQEPKVPTVPPNPPPKIDD
jgi:hypothetical protein